MQEVPEGGQLAFEYGKEERPSDKNPFMIDGEGKFFIPPTPQEVAENKRKADEAAKAAREKLEEEIPGFRKRLLN